MEKFAGQKCWISSTSPEIERGTHVFFCCERLSASMARSLHLSLSLFTTSRLTPWTRAALKVALLENKTVQMWHLKEKRLVVISCENALSDDEVGIIIMMSAYFMRIPGKDLFANCLSRVNQDLDWGVVGETHLRLLVYNRDHPMEAKKLMSYPLGSMEAIRSPTWLESLTAYAYEVEKGNIEAFCATVIVLRTIAEVVVVIPLTYVATPTTRWQELYYRF